MSGNELSEDTAKVRRKAKQLVASKDLQRILRVNVLLLGILDYPIEQRADVVHFGELCATRLQQVVLQVGCEGRKHGRLFQGSCVLEQGIRF